MPYEIERNGVTVVALPREEAARTVGLTRRYLEQMISLIEQTAPAPPQGWRYGSREAYVLARGEPMRFAPRPKGVRLGPIKQCFKNASELVVAHPDWRYAEGYAWPPGLPFPVEHGWALTPDGCVVDNTLRDATEATDYFGVVYERSAYLAYIASEGYYGVLGGSYRGAQAVLKAGGLPLGEEADR